MCLHQTISLQATELIGYCRVIFEITVDYIQVLGSEFLNTLFCWPQDVKHEGGDWLLFGSEVDGLPSAALEQCSTGQYAGGTIRLPMSETYVRSLNLSVSAGVAVYEALRQLDAHTNYSSLDVSPSEAMESVNSGHNDGFP